MIRELVASATGTAWAALTLAAAAAAAPQLPQVQAARIRAVDQAFTFSAPLWGPIPNCTAHAQDVLRTHAGWQYLAYWDHDRRLALGRRKLPFGAWDVIRFEDYRAGTQDAHNSVDLGICVGDGTLHLAFDHHVDTLNYRVSVPGLASQPESFTWDAAWFSPVTDTLILADGPVTRLTYPRFVSTPSGGLHLVYREFGSGDGRSRIVDYHPAAAAWSDNRVFIERRGAHDDPLGGHSDARNPYFNRIDYDRSGVLHATWTWREKAPTRYNRDICYAYSLDEGRTWRNNAGSVVADAATGRAIDAASPGVTVVPLGAEWGLMNSQGHAVDSQGRVHVVMYHKTQPDTQVSYGNLWNSRYFHYWRELDGTWHGQQLASMGSRPTLLAGPDDALLLVFRDGRSLVVDAASAGAGWQDWNEIWRRPLEMGSETQADVALLAEHGVLSVAGQESPPQPGDATRIGVADLLLR